jgi:hypothetical protein
MNGNTTDYQVLDESHEVEREKTNRIRTAEKYGRRSGNKNESKM